MNLDERTYERLADFMDGGPVELTDQERLALREIAADERAINARLAVAPSPLAMERARHVIQAQCDAARPARRPYVKLARYASAAVAVAAVIMLAVVLNRPIPPEPENLAGGQAAVVTAEVIANSYSRPDEIVALEERLEELESDILASADDGRDSWMYDPFGGF